MFVQPLFACPFGVEQLDIDNQRILNFCLEEEKNSNAPMKPIGWQSGFLDFSHPDLKDLLDVINQKISMVNHMYCIQEEHLLKLSSGWININKPRGRTMQNNLVHNHPGRFVSFVYYVKVPQNSGNLILYSPLNNILGYAIPNQVYRELNSINSLNWLYEPKECCLVMFPGWVQHRAEDNQSNEDRICIAFNADLQNLNLILNPEIKNA